MELELEVGDRAAHAVLERLAGVADVVDHRAIPLLRDRLTEERAQQPVHRAVLVLGEALDRDAIDHRQADAVAELLADPRHHLAAGRQREVRGREEQERERIAPERADRRRELGRRLVRERHEPVRRGDASPEPRAFVADVLEDQSGSDSMSAPPLPQPAPPNSTLVPAGDLGNAPPRMIARAQGA